MTPASSNQSQQISRTAIVVATGAGILLAATGALWAHYGTAVFYETIVAGIATCL